jgi:thiol-disulfide isomerase/thioredoxin
MNLGQTIGVVMAAGLLSLLAGYGVNRWLGPERPNATAALEPVPAAQTLLLQLPLAEFADFSGTRHNLSKWRSHVVLLNFWASWCPPCRTEIPDLMALQQAYGERGLRVIGIAVDDPDAARQFAEKLGINFPLLVGGIDALDLSRSLGNRFSALPFTALFDRQGQAVLVEAGEQSRNTLEQQIQPLL